MFIIRKIKANQKNNIYNRTLHSVIQYERSKNNMYLFFTRFALCNFDKNNNFFKLFNKL